MGYPNSRAPRLDWRYAASRRPAPDREEIDLSAEQNRTIAVLGASRARHKFGNKGVRAYVAGGWSVFPVNLTDHEIEGLTAYPTLAAANEAAGGKLDRVSVYLRPEVTLRLLSEITAVDAGETFFNPGSADAEVLRLAEELGIVVRDACSIVDIGLSPSQFP